MILHHSRHRINKHRFAQSAHYKIEIIKLAQKHAHKPNEYKRNNFRQQNLTSRKGKVSDTPPGELNL